MPRIADQLRGALRSGTREGFPFRHWIVRECLPPEEGRALAALGLPMPDIRRTLIVSYVNPERRSRHDWRFRGRRSGRLIPRLADRDPWY